MAELQERYRFLSVIGEGGFGRVYRARLEAQEGFHKEVAIKVLQEPNPSMRMLRLFKDEARILGMIRDRAVVNIEAPIRIDDRWALVMEFVDGVSCGTLLRTCPLPPGVAVEIVAEVARAVHNVYHMAGSNGFPLRLLHRDLKPDNLQITRSGEVKILDFGIARADISNRQFKTKNSIGGTPGYIAPERIRGIEVPAGDVYSLGVVLYELVVGARPDQKDVPELAHRIEDAHHDPSLRQILALSERMRALDPGERPTAREVERSCHRIRHAIDGIYLREWAEESVHPDSGGADDALVGQLVRARPPEAGESLGGSVGGFTLDLSEFTEGISPPMAAFAAASVFGTGLLVAGLILGMISIGIGLYRLSHPNLQLSALAPTALAPTAPPPAPSAVGRRSGDPPRASSLPQPSLSTVHTGGDVSDVWLVRDGQRFAPGKIPPGIYSVWAMFRQIGETRTELALIVEPGETYRIHCLDASASCRVDR